MVYKKRRDYEEIEIYDDGMDRKVSKKLFIKQKNPESIGVVRTPAKLLHFYSYRVKKVTYLAVQPLNFKADAMGEPIVVDSVVRLSLIHI